jgi:hypothetical protein
MNTTQPPWYALVGLAGLSAGIFMGVTAAALATSDNTIRSMMAGAAIGLVTTSFNYYFGSSAGSAKKDDTIANNAAVAAGNVPVAPPPGGTP